MNQEIKGISLIVLVITIIIIIILAGAVILSLNNSDIISKAKLAKESNDLVAIKEAVETEKSNVMLSGGTVNVTVPDAYKDDIYISPIGGIFLKPNANPKITNVDNAINILGAAYLPTGFNHIEGTLKEGIVIEDVTGTATDGNQFVWVPVPDVSEFVRENYLNDSDWSNYTSLITTDTTNEGYKMKESVTKYKGFYIARYEAGNVGNVAVSKPDQIVYNNIDWATSQSKSQSMYPTSTTIGMPISTLIYAEQWDAAMRYMKDVPNSNISGAKYITNSTQMGEYSQYDQEGTIVVQGSLQRTGAYKVKNIYDMAGNVYEWTMEAHYTDDRVVRGGSCSDVGAYSPASGRFGGTSDIISADYGFRSALYIK